MVPMLFIMLFIFIIYLWVRGLEYMKTHHPDYKGEDFFGDSPPPIKKHKKHEDKG